MPDKLLILIGSPRKTGTSASFAQALVNSAGKSSVAVSIKYAIDYCDGRKSIDDLLQAAADATIMGIVSPMYVDTLPFPVIWCLENLSGSGRQVLSGKRLFAVFQYGFPDLRLAKPSLEVCRCFAMAAEMKWMGGLGYGGGPLINGASLDTLGSKGARIAGALESALMAVLDEREIPAEVQTILAEKIPSVLFWPLAQFMNLFARREAKKLGTDLDARPYL